MSTETVFVGKDEHQITTAPVTVVFNAAPYSTYYPDYVMITPEMSLEHFGTLAEIDPYTAGLFKLVVTDYPHDVTLENIKTAPDGFKQLIGLFALSLQFLAAKKKFGWKYPETQLHPRYQGNLADVLIMFNMPEQFVKFIQEVRNGLLS